MHRAAAAATSRDLPKPYPPYPNTGKNKTDLPSVLCRQATCPEGFISCPSNICLSPNATDSGLTEDEM
jgi:hypothetical protein